MKSVTSILIAAIAIGAVSAAPAPNPSYNMPTNTLSARAPMPDDNGKGAEGFLGGVGKALDGAAGKVTGTVKNANNHFTGGPDVDGCDVLEAARHLDEGKGCVKDKGSDADAKLKCIADDLKQAEENNDTDDENVKKCIDVAKARGIFGKDEGKKDEGKKDEGKKDEGKKDEGKKDEGKKGQDPAAADPAAADPAAANPADPTAGADGSASDAGSDYGGSDAGMGGGMDGADASMGAGAGGDPSAALPPV